MTNKNRNFFIVIVSVSIVLIFIVSLFILGDVTKFFSLTFKDRLTLLIAFWGLFATFGGAYLGAKVSSDKAIKLNDYNNKRENVKFKYERNIEFERLIKSQHFFFNEELPQAINNHKKIDDEQREIDIILNNVGQLSELSFKENEAIKNSEFNIKYWKQRFNDDFDKLIEFITTLKKERFYKIDSNYRESIGEIERLYQYYLYLSEIKNSEDDSSSDIYFFLENTIERFKGIEWFISMNEKEYKYYHIE